MTSLTYSCWFLIQLSYKRLSHLEFYVEVIKKRQRHVPLVTMTFFSTHPLPIPSPIKFQLGSLKVNFVKSWPFLTGLAFMLQAFQSYASPHWMVSSRETKNYEEFTAQHSFPQPLGLLVPLACLLVCKAFLPSLTIRLWSVDDITLLPLSSPACATVFSSPPPHCTDGK